MVGGSSAGGNISAVLAQLSRLGEFSRPITGQYLSVPLIAPLHLFPEKYKEFLISPYENVDDPVLRYVGAERLQGATHSLKLQRLADYASTDLQTRLKVDEQSNLFSPLASPSYPSNAAEEQYPLAPAYMQVGGLDRKFSQKHVLSNRRVFESTCFALVN